MYVSRQKLWTGKASSFCESCFLAGDYFLFFMAACCLYGARTPAIHDTDSAMHYIYMLCMAAYENPHAISFVSRSRR